MATLLGFCLAFTLQSSLISGALLAQTPSRAVFAAGLFLSLGGAMVGLGNALRAPVLKG